VTTFSHADGERQARGNFMMAGIRGGGQMWNGQDPQACPKMINTCKTLVTLTVDLICTNVTIAVQPGDLSAAAE